MQKKYLLAPGAYRWTLRQVGADGRLIDKRARARTSEFKVAALLCTSSWPAPISCIVHDHSETGARLQLDDPKSARKMAVHIPRQVRLHLLPQDLHVDCRIVWREGTHFGVEYLGHMRPTGRGAE